ncbi:MAG: class I SAM-dependent methyltransferase [Deltaproteobacteria bacterium]|nr:class I SAM-dependent methyltransferase [Deltaproteobacteria bacterium]
MPTRSSAPRTLARRADKYSLYLASVQAPDYDVRFFTRVYRAEHGVVPKLLREDFSGTAAICCEWTKLGLDHVAYGVDLDPVPLEWGRAHNLSKLSPHQRARVQLVEADVRDPGTPKVDVIAALNFSYCCFKTRTDLREYFTRARRSLRPGGLLVVDLLGGYEVFEDEREDVTEHDGFDYVWEQASFDPITHHAVFHIHFRFRDGSELQRAFTYDWRLWTIPEVSEVMIEAGFAGADVYWEGTDHATGDGDGVYRKRTRGEADASWNAYIVGRAGSSARIQGRRDPIRGRAHGDARR